MNGKDHGLLKSRTFRLLFVPTTKSLILISFTLFLFCSQIFTKFQSRVFKKLFLLQKHKSFTANLSHLYASSVNSGKSPWYKTMRQKMKSGLIALRPGLQKLGPRKRFVTGLALA